MERSWRGKSVGVGTGEGDVLQDPLVPPKEGAIPTICDHWNTYICELLRLLTRGCQSV